MIKMVIFILSLVQQDCLATNSKLAFIVPPNSRLRFVTVLYPPWGWGILHDTPLHVTGMVMRPYAAFSWDHDYDL